MRTICLVACSFLFVATLGCSEQAVPTALTETVDMSASKNGPPAQSGPIVFRYEDFRYFGAQDPDNGNVVYLGIDWVKICLGQPAYDPLAYQDVILLDEEGYEDDRVKRLIKGDNIFAAVWNPNPTSCAAAINGEGLIGTGIADLVYTDNDYFGFRPDRINTNAFGWNAYGFIETAEGPVKLTAHYRCIYGSQSRCSVSVQLK